jgi:class 3 adenylate cyclase
MREPVHVFTLLETIYHEFDQIAKRRRVFKVETVGDCYVAVAGLPEHRKDHAVVMVRCSNVMFLVDFSNPTATKSFLVSPFVFLRLVLLVIACTRCISWCGS